MDKDKKKQIMQLVYSGKLSAEEGASIYKQLREKTMDIAIVGMSGVFPKAENAEQYWNNLIQGINCIQDINNRWDFADMYSEDRSRSDKAYCKWGGLLKEPDNFDPAFFELSPRQAELMEPRQRLFLREAWKAIEDAGYSQAELNGKLCGVFAGCEGSSDYFKDMKQEKMNGHVVLGHSNAILSARISYFMNLQGPSVTIDTACSSSLVAIHEACLSILKGDCEMAIAGGATVMTDPGSYMLLCKMGMLSPEGQCKTFDEGADGFVPGEAVAAFVLKPLKSAQRDKDHIYGVIKASGTNQDGKTNGITAPSALSQERLEKRLYDTYQISPESISYVEAHGTGTRLGDPIEVEALTRAFGSMKGKEGYCGIGSVKTNIGHAAAASGAASLMKVLLSMKYGYLPPSLNFKRLNNQITFQGSPFYMVEKPEKWLPSFHPLKRAAISSFGQSGTNCHMIVEEYSGEVANPASVKDTYLVPFSAKSPEALTNILCNFRSWLEGKDCSMDQLSCHLFLHRDHYAYRCCFLVKNQEELLQTLLKVLKGERTENFYRREDVSGETLEDIKSPESLKDALISAGDFDLIYKSHILDLLQFYLTGKAFDWSCLFGERYTRLSMPIYGFCEKSYRLKQEDLKSEKVEVQGLCPVIDSNESTLLKHCYKKVFSGREFYLTDHMHMLPGVVYMEMMRAAGEAAHSQQLSSIRNIYWSSPIVVEENHPVTVYINLYPKKEEEIQCEIVTLENGRETVHARGTLIYGGVKSVTQSDNKDSKERYDIVAIKGRCSGGKEAAGLFIKRMTELKVEVGEHFRGMQEIYYNEKEALSRLDIPESLEDTFLQYTIHPTLIDGGFQSVVTWLYHTVSDTKHIYLPFSLGELSFKHHNGRICYAYITKNSDDGTEDVQLLSYNVKFLDKDGIVVFSYHNFISRQFSPDVFLTKNRLIDPEELLYYKETLRLQDFNQDAAAIPEVDTLVIFDTDTILYEKLQKDRGTFVNLLLVEKSTEFQRKKEKHYSINPKNGQGYQTLIKEIYRTGKEEVTFLFNWARSAKEFEEQIILGAHALLHLTKSLMQVPVHGKTRILYLTGGEETGLALGGFAKTLRIEKPQYHCTILQYEKLEELLPHLGKELLDCSHTEICYKDRKRYSRTLEEVSQKKNTGTIKHKGAYLITGGAGGIGQILAEYLITTYHATVIVTGRSPMSERLREQLLKIDSTGKQLIYKSCDIQSQAETVQMFTGLLKSGQELNGIFHSAGIIRDGLISGKELDVFDQVWEPKIQGSLNLLYAAKDLKPDFIAFFSSTSGVMGNMGQCDYSFANRFMDFIALRECREGRKVISISWPLWADGGMALNEGVKRMLKNTYGMTPLPGQEGMIALEHCLMAEEGHMVVLHGEKAVIRKMMKDKLVTDNSEAKNRNAAEMNHVQINVNEVRIVKEKTVIEKADSKEAFVKEQFLKDMGRMIGSILSINPEQIFYDTNLSDYGFDSISFSDLAAKLNEEFDLGITPAIFFGFTTLHELLEYLLQEFMEKIMEKYLLAEEDYSDLASGDTSEKTLENEQIANLQIQIPDDSLQKSNVNNELEHQDFMPIAIIGISGRMPQSENLDIFWENLIHNRDLITEIPKDRWDWEAYYGDPHTEPGKTNIKWAGFMKEIDKFDPLFFGIPGIDAENMDPQERIILEEIWHAMEDAAYRPEELSGTNTGVFIGISSGDYKELMIEKGISTILSQTFAANRISYLLNLRGPSEPVDTACSSSLAAVHKAVEAIQRGSCNMAFAGGINVITSPNLFISQGKMNMLSPDGRCKTFDQAANGYARGEGTAAVLLKPLAKAVEDKDHIYGVIRGSAINHGGHASNLYAPNAKAQAEVIIKAYETGNIDPDTVSYIECHGTGTALGDPVEIEGLKNAFKHLYSRKGHALPTGNRIGLGAVKTNIGHLEAASGIAGLSKILYSFQKGIFPGNIHFKQQNPYIMLEDTPFYIVDENESFRIKKSDGQALPRRVSLSSFGVGGVNVHMVLEDYEMPSVSFMDRKYELIVLSAKTRESLQAYVKNLSTFLEGSILLSYETTNVLEEELAGFISKMLDVPLERINVLVPLEEYGLDQLCCHRLQEYIQENYKKEFLLEAGRMSIRELANRLKQDRQRQVLNTSPALKEDFLKALAYTLQTGREEFKERIAFVTDSGEDLQRQLKEYMEGNTGKAYNRKEEITVKAVNNLPPTKLTNAGLLQLEEAAGSWVNGGRIDWNSLYEEGEKPCRISAPVYPFARESYWLESLKETNSMKNKGIAKKDMGVRDESEEREDFTQDKNSETGEDFSISEYRKLDGTIIEELETGILTIFGDLLKISPGRIAKDSSFEDYGLDSVRVIYFSRELSEKFKFQLEALDILEHNTVAKLAEYIANKNAREIPKFQEEDKTSQSIIAESPFKDTELLNYKVRVKREKIGLISGSKEFDQEEFEGFWDRLKNGETEELNINKISGFYLQELNKLGYRYVHLLVENANSEMAEIYIAGEGKPLVIITGIGMTPAFCTHQIKEFSKHRKVICFSMPGVGLSSKTKDLSLKNIAAFVMKGLEVLDIHKGIDLIGVSWGSLAACTIAYEYPQAVDKMILVAPNSNMVKNSYDDSYIMDLDEIMKLDFMGVPGGEEAFNLYQKAKCIDIKTFALYGRYFSPDSPSHHITYPFLDRIKTPALIVYGDKDQIIEREDAELVYIRIPQSKFMTIRGAGHIPMVTHYEEFNRLADKFFHEEGKV